MSLQLKLLHYMESCFQHIMQGIYGSPEYLLEPDADAVLLDCGCHNDEHSSHLGIILGSRHIYGLDLNQGLTEEAIFQSVRVICFDLNMSLPFVVTFRSLHKALQRAGFRIEAALGFGYYPLPPLLADLASKIDPAHAHHMVIKARKPA